MMLFGENPIPAKSPATSRLALVYFGPSGGAGDAAFCGVTMGSSASARTNGTLCVYEFRGRLYRDSSNEDGRVLPKPRDDQEIVQWLIRGAI